MFLHSLSSFLYKHCICGHKCDYSIVDMPSLRSARYICLAANSICFRFAQARYDIDPRSRSEHIECVSTYRTRQRISKIRASGSISTRSVLKGTTLNHISFFSLPLEGKVACEANISSASAHIERVSVYRKSREGFISYRIGAKRQYIEFEQSENISSSSFVNIFHESEYIDRRRNKSKNRRICFLLLLLFLLVIRVWA